METTQNKNIRAFRTDISTKTEWMNVYDHFDSSTNRKNLKKILMKKPSFFLFSSFLSLFLSLTVQYYH